MINEQDEMLFSQLADGEIDSDQLNELLLKVLDDPQGRERLKEMLRLRQSTANWRAKQPPQPVLVVAERPRPSDRSRLARRMSGWAVAACVGGLLVLAGVWAGGWIRRPVQPRPKDQIAQGPDATPTVAQVTPEQMLQVSRVFALHESVAGPLAWYAADDRNIKLANASAAEARNAPIAILLKLESASDGGQARTCIIVCRESEYANVELPGPSPGAPGFRAYVAPQSANGRINVQYAIALEGSPDRPAVLASVSGQRRVGLDETSLGQLAVGDRLINVEASAWPIREEKH